MNIKEIKRFFILSIYNIRLVI